MGKPTLRDLDGEATSLHFVPTAGDARAAYEEQRLGRLHLLHNGCQEPGRWPHICPHPIHVSLSLIEPIGSFMCTGEATLAFPGARVPW